MRYTRGGVMGRRPLYFTAALFGSVAQMTTINKKATSARINIGHPSSNLHDWCAKASQLVRQLAMLGGVEAGQLFFFRYA